MYQDTKLLIDGEWRAGSQGDRIDVINPATGACIGDVARASVHDLEEAVAAAARAFRIWSRTSAIERAKVLRAAAVLLRERSARIAQILTLEQGKPIKEALAEVTNAAESIDWFAEEGKRSYGRVIPGRSSGVQQLALKSPMGIVVALTPWNFPVSQIVKKLAAALAAGCSIIVKGPEETPSAPSELIRVFQDAGVPSGATALVFGIPAEISEYLIAHPLVAKVSFTGSTAVGKRLAALAGQHMKRATMELGGHAPVIVCKDADIESSISVMTSAKFRNAGQICAAPTRFLVHDKHYAQFVTTFTKIAASLKVGDGLDPKNDMGPLAHDRRLDAMETFVSDAIARGAKIQCGGHRIGNHGFFFEPTVITEASRDTKIMNEEPFGPVAVIQPFSHLNDAIQEANRLQYGLGAFAFTKDIGEAARISAEVRAGMISINHNGLALVETPFGGVGDSGYGYEGGPEGLAEYLDTKFVTQLSA